MNSRIYTIVIYVFLFVALFAGCGKSAQDKLMPAVLKNDIEELKDLFGEQIDVNAVDEEGMTALIHASLLGHLDIVKLLLRNNADPLITDNQGNTAYDVATENGQSSVAVVLLKTGMPIDRKFWITSQEGLRLRRDPGLLGEKIIVIPYAEEIRVLAESVFEVSIDGEMGRWSEVEWNGSTGWLYNAYITDDPGYFFTIEENSIYQAEHVVGVRATDAGRTALEEIHFIGDRRCTYTRIEYSFDAKVITTHLSSSSSVGGKRVEMILGDGEEKAMIHEDFGGGEVVKSVPGWNFTLVWNEDIQGFLKGPDSDKVRNAGYSLDRKTYQYKRARGDEFEYIGYFHKVAATGK